LDAARCNSSGTSPVCSYNEWDPLEEVIVGRLDGATIPPAHISVTANMPSATSKLYRLVGGRRHPKWLIEAAQKELDEFIKILNSEGVIVRRPDAFDFSVPYRTPHWRSKGFCTASPRDGLLVVGDEIIEAPMSWRSRYFEMHPYRPLLKEYFLKGARWTAAPKPQLLDALYDEHYSVPGENESMRYLVTDFEPVFDAADFVRCGRDIFYIKSNATNEFGVTWLRRHLGDEYRLHCIETCYRQPLHIDSTFMPLAPGKLMVNPDRIDIARLPSLFKSWDTLTAPEPEPVSNAILRLAGMCSKWISMNVLMLDEKRVIVERDQPSMIAALKRWGFQPIPCPFQHYAVFGGSFHCATLDIRRRGTLQSYF